MDSSKSFEEKFMRICKVAQTDKDTGLAKILEIKAPSVAAARKRQQIPTGWVEKIALKFNVSADWIFFGRGPMKIDDFTNQAKSGENIPSDIECKQLSDPLKPSGSKLEHELELERKERRELAAEVRKLYRDKEELLRENGALRERLARFEARQDNPSSLEEDRGPECF